MKNVNYYIVCPDRRVYIDSNQIAEVRKIAAKKYPDALRIERETVREDVSVKKYLV